MNADQPEDPIFVLVDREASTPIDRASTFDRLRNGRLVKPSQSDGQSL